MLKPPQAISYDDLIDAAEVRLKWMESAYPGKVLSGEMKSYTATHNLECQRATVKLLKKFKREPQLDLFTEFTKMKG